MILKALEMQGFKSFPEKTVLTFGRGITAVVGPNGSGKSNVSDAVRWVLGEQSSKSLRGSKMEDVIFDGTKVRKAYGYAQVTLRLDNKDRSISSVDEDEVAVTRRYFRSGESEYKINGENVRLKDVHELFMDTGLGRDGYSMVSQGKIADMISGKGSECREMLEEAAGISAYRYRRNDSLKKLNAAEDNLIRLRDILAELEGRIGPLKTQSEKAQKFLVLAEERKNLEIGLWLYNIDKLRADLRRQEDNIALADGQYGKILSELSDIEEKIELAFAASQNITARIDEIRVQISENEQTSAELKGQCAVLENSIEHNNQTIERIEKEKASSNEDKEALLNEIDGEEKLISQIKTIASKKKEELSLVEETLRKMSEQGGSIEDESGLLNAEISQYTKAVSDKRVEVLTAQSSLDEINERLKNINETVKQKEENLSSAEAECKKTEKSLSECEEKVTSLSNSISGLEMIYKSHFSKADKLKMEIDDASFEVNHISSKAKMLEDLEKNMDGYAGSVKAVIKESSKGTLRGIKGTVSQLISTDEKYAVAVETALGNAVQNIICETETDAKKAIEYLKKNNAGRATFQPVSSVKGRTLDEEGLEENEGFMGIASDLVKCDEIYREIVVSLLGRIAVCEDLDYGVILAKKYKHRFKIVTLDGQVINAGGSMTGGSQTKHAGILSRGMEIERLHKKYDEKKKALDEMKETYEKLDKSLLEEEAKLNEAKQWLSSAQEEKIRLEGEKRLCDEQFFTLKASFDELVAEKDKNAQRANELKEFTDKVNTEIEALTKKIEEGEKRLQLLDVKQGEISKKREEISSEMSKLRLDIHDADRDLTARMQSLNLLKVRFISHQNKDKELEEEIKAIENQNETLKDEIKSLSEKAEKLIADCDNLRNEIVNLQKERTSYEEQNTSLRALQKEKSSQKEVLGGEKARLEERKASMTQEYDSTINKLFDEYQLTLREAQETAEKTAEPTLARKNLSEIKNKIRALGNVNVAAIDEYKEVSERYEFMSSQLEDVEKSKRELTRLINELTDKMSTQFREQFTKINNYFGETFKELFGGGHAEITLLDPTDVLESQIDIKLQPPGKNVKRLDSLSGGEKGLSAISLLFAILKVNPAPFCIFDEVEAALDDVNVTRYAQYVRRMTKNTQFILITHRRGTMEEADMLYGITMQEQGVSKLLELKTAELAAKLGIATN